MNVTFDRKQLRHFQKVAAWADENEDRRPERPRLLSPTTRVWGPGVNGRLGALQRLAVPASTRIVSPWTPARRLRGAQVIVTNYHLFLRPSPRESVSAAGDVILPTASTVICDEAHDHGGQSPGDFFGMRLSPFSVTMLVRGANHLRHGGDGRSGCGWASRARFFGRVPRHGRTQT